MLIKDDFALCAIKLESRICLELFSNIKSMGRIALKDDKEVVASGVITELLY